MSHTGHSQPFLSLCNNIEAAVSGLKTRHPIFVVKHGDHDLVLGQPFLNAIKFSQNYKPDRVFGIIIHLQTKKLAVFCILLPKNPANQIENHLFP